VGADAERPQLREYRLQLGWTQQEMADRIAHLAWMERRERAGVNADMVAKWERGAKGISPRYRELLCRLFGVTPDQLGLKNVPSAGAQRGPAKADDQSLVAMLDNAAGLLDQLGAAGTALAPHMLHVWKEAVTSRRTMLGLLDPGATDPIGHARATTASVADLEQLTERYQALYDTADPAALLTSVAAHVRMAQDTLRQNPPTDMRRRLLHNLAEVAILAGQLVADDLGNTISGRAYYGLALDAAREVADDRLTAIAHGHAAQLAAAEGLTIAALDHLAAGNEHVRPTPAIACWLATIEAIIHAGRGEHTPARDALDRARTILDQAGRWPAPASCRHLGAPQLNAATGHVLSLAGAYTEACKELLAALDQSHPIPRRPHILILIDLATAELHSGALPTACSHATQAADLLHHAAYAVGAARLRTFRTVAQRPLDDRALRALDEHLTRLAA
jgi:transcriptional regulator with XRE-family HTH domain